MLDLSGYLKTSKMNRILLILLIPFFFIYTGCKHEKSETYSPGFRIIKALDKSRIYKPGSDSTDNLHFRPLEIDMWYPAKAMETDSVMIFRDILGLLEQRAIYYTGANSWKGVTSQIAQSFCDDFKCSDSAKLLNFKTNSYKNALPAQNKFPLIIYLCAYNGMSYENYALFENLAAKGYVVISISSIGRFPGDMTMKKEDLFEQVSDAIYSFQTIKQNPGIDFSKIGIIGYSWGGLTGAILSDRIPGVKCVVSLDGSEYHHYGESKEENADFDDLSNSIEFRDVKLSVPYLRLESSPEKVTEKTDSVYDFSKKLSREFSIIKIDSAQHEDFSCLSLIVRESGNCKINTFFNKSMKLVLDFLDDHLKN